MGILNLIRRGQGLRKIFGKRELVIIQKQLLGLPLKKSEVMRLSRDIRKKLEAIKDISRFSSEFELKRGAELKNIINEAKEIILQNKLYPRIKKIILFGSTVENKLTFDSDIDIAVEFNNITKKEAINFRKEVMGSINEKVDIQVYNILEDKMKKEISNKGKGIYEQSH